MSVVASFRLWNTGPVCCSRTKVSMESKRINADQHCTVFLTMEFTDVRSEESTVSLIVAVSVLADSDFSHKLSGSSWQVRRTDSATNATSTYAGVFPNLEDLPPTDDSNAITGLLITIRSAIGRALVENGVIPKQDTDQIGRVGARQI